MPKKNACEEEGEGEIAVIGNPFHLYKSAN